MKPQRYIKKPDKPVHAIQIKLDTNGFTYKKWGDRQTCKSGDWLVNNGGDIYTIDQQVFSDTYRQIAPATFQKIAPVWARRADEDGSVKTKEGRSHYRAGDFIVANHEDGSDAWCMSVDKFQDMYEQVEDG